MEDKTYCPVLDVNDFCPCCSIVDDIQTAFKELLTAEDPRPSAHVIATPHAEAVVKAWKRIAEQYDHPGAQFILTWNDNFIVVSEPM